MKNILYLISAVLLLQSCFNTEKKSAFSSSAAMQVSPEEGTCPFLSQDNKGNLVLSWIKNPGSSQSVLSYAVSPDGGKTFGKITEIPGSGNVQPHGENMPKIIYKASGEIIAVWGASNPNPANEYAGMIFYSQSFDEGETWSQPTKLVRDTAGFDQRYFDVSLLPNGEVAIVWLDNRKQTTSEGSALYFAETNGNSGFQNEQLVSEPCCPCCRTDLFIDSKKNIHIVYRGIINDSIRDMVHTVSTDNGKTFSQPERISKDNWVIYGCPHTGPAISENKNGLQLTWFTAGGAAGIYYCASADDGKTFSPRQMVSGSGAKHCQITSMPGDNLLIVWNENFSKNNSSCIGIEMRNQTGENLVKEYITSTDEVATFPVVKPIDKKTAFIAYTQTINDKDYIKYKTVEF